MRRKPPAKWVLPENINPIGRKCIQVQVPDDPAHIAAFRGALLALQAAYNWADDPAHTARSVALVWREIIDGLTSWGCGMTTILREYPGGCGIQWSIDDGATWETIDLSACISAIAENSFNIAFPGAFSDALNQAIADGRVQANGLQGSPSPAVLPGNCQSWHVVLQARENWICPAPVSPGSVITVSAASGGWNDGAVYWYCPDGNSYGLSICTPGTAHYEPSDPLPTSHHMVVVGRLSIDGDWFEPVSPGYTVPAGKAEQLFILQANDGTLSDNYGEIQFDVQICQGGWTLDFDFAGGQLGWRSSVDVDPVYGERIWAEYSGIYWIQNNVHTNGPSIDSPQMSTHGNIKKVEIWLAAPEMAYNPGCWCDIGWFGDLKRINGSLDHYVFDVDWALSQQRVRLLPGNGSIQQINTDQIARVRLIGDGSAPTIE